MPSDLVVETRRLLIGQLMVLAAIFEMAVSDRIEACNTEEVRILCSSNNVIYVTSAEYGRMDVGKCITEVDEFLGCSNDVLPLLDSWCSGRQECNFVVGNDKLEAANQNCLKILIKYLKVEYSCVEVEKRCSSVKSNIVKNRMGYLSSSTLDTKGCGSQRSPWIISAQPGQTIRLDLIDFAANQQSYSMISCRYVYGFVVEKSLGINYTVCGGQSRERELYTSKTNSLEISFVSRQRRSAGNFLVKYSVTGCSEIVPPAHAWYKREGNEAVFGCENNDQEWRLRCVDNNWIGEVGNCSETVVQVKQEASHPSTFHMSSVVVISGIAGAAVVLSVIAVVSGVVYINKYRMKQEVKRANLYKTYSTLGSNMQAYYRPVTGDQSENNAACWDMSVPAINQMTLLSDKCTCPTLQMRNTREGDRTEGDRSLERQSLYSSIRST